MKNVCRSYYNNLDTPNYQICDSYQQCVIAGATVTVVALHASFFDAEALPQSEDPEQFPMIEQVWHGHLPLFLPPPSRIAMRMNEPNWRIQLLTNMQVGIVTDIF